MGKILSGITEVLLIPSADSIKVMVNGKPLSLPAVGEQLIQKSPEGKILVILKHFHDNVPSWGDDLAEGDQLRGTVGTSLDNQGSLSSGDELFSFNITDETGLEDTIQKTQDGGPGPSLWSLDGDMD